MPPLRLLVVSAGVAAIVALELYEPYILGFGLLSVLGVPLGIAFLIAVALRPRWARPMGNTVGGLLLLDGTGHLLMSISALYSRWHQDVAAYLAAIGAARLVVGLLLLWCMRQWIVAEWFAPRDRHHDGPA